MLIGMAALAAFSLAARLPQLPSVSWALALLTAVLLTFLCFWRSSWLLLLALFLLFFIRAVSWGQAQLQDRVKPLYESRDIIVQGYVDGLPERQAQRQRFEFVVTAAFLPGNPEPIDFPSRIRLTDYRWQQTQVPGGVVSRAVGGGQGWRLLIRVKRPHGFANPGGFDYELWLFSRAIGATGYVREWIEPVVHNALWARVHRWRESIRAIFEQRMETGPVLGVALALTVGDRSAISAEGSDRIRRAGLSHLLAISGLHISLIAGLGFLLGRQAGAALAIVFPCRYFGPQVGVVVALGLAGLYSLLSGFGIPVQRALIMLLVWSLWFLSNRYYSPWVSWWVSMALVLWLQPLSVLLAGFWFSFAAVAALIVLSGRAAELGWGAVKTTLFLQVGLFFLLGAVQLFWGLGVNPCSAMINLVAIPYVSLLVVPALLLSVAVSYLSATATGYLVELCSHLIQYFWQALDLLEGAGALMYLVPQKSVSFLEMLGLIASLLVMMARLGLATRVVSGLLASVLIFRVLFTAAEPSLQTNQVTVLDVGQGLAVVVESAGQSLLYDTGPSYSEHFDAGKAVVVPFLKDRGVTSLEHLIISHNDNDHIGGYGSVIREMPVAKVWFGEQEQKQKQSRVNSCDQSRTWMLGSMEVSIIGLQESGPPGIANANNLSCVVLIEQRGFRLLLPGDLEVSREMALLSHPRLQQPVDVVVAAHHGSITSSSQRLIAQLSPQWVVFSAGYKNRYHHPHTEVLGSYREVGSEWVCSADSGAVSFQISRQGAVKVSRFRLAERRYWRDFQHKSCEGGW